MIRELHNNPDIQRTNYISIPHGVSQVKTATNP